MFGTAVANWQIQLRPDRDGSTNLVRFLFDLSLNQGGEKQPQRGLCPLLVISFAISVSPILTSNVDSTKAGLNAAIGGSKPGLHAIRAGWVAAEVTPHTDRDKKGCTLCCSVSLV